MSPTPNFAMPGTNESPRSRPIWPNVVLHDAMKLAVSVPPHESPPKFLSVTLVCGSGSALSTGYTLSGDVTPSSSATPVVTTLNVEPGG